jgi:Skp family chaperone for outer membrane proteins
MMPVFLALAYRAPLVALAAAVWLLAGAAVSAQDLVVEEIGVVDLQKILRDSVAAKGVRDRVEKKQEAYRGEIAAQENGLRTEQEELQRQRTVLAPEVFATREEEFNNKVEALQRDVVDRNKELEEALAYGMQQVQSSALNIIAELADQRGFALVLDKSQVLLVAKEMDFSAEVITLLNERLPSVSTEPPAAEE